MMISVHRTNYNQEELRRYLYLIEEAKGKGFKSVGIAFSKKDYIPAPIEELKKLGYRIEVIGDGKILIQHKISWDMEKLTAAEAKKIALSKSDAVKEILDDYLVRVKSQAEKGLFTCNIQAIYSELNEQVICQLKELGYEVICHHDFIKMDISIRW